MAVLINAKIHVIYLLNKYLACILYLFTERTICKNFGLGKGKNHPWQHQARDYWAFSGASR
jgi:hypothetical protein